MRILHVAAHLGGGIGSAYAGLGDCGQEQSILLLEPPQDRAALSKVKAAGFRILQSVDSAAVDRELRQADAVVFSWHHHPALTEFLHDFPAVPIRSILWCHISGNYFPHIQAEFVTKFNQCMWAAPYSVKLSQIQALGDDYARKHFQIVYGLNDLSRFYDIRRETHDFFQIGYVGTLGFCKLHPSFVDFCAAVKMPDAQFSMVGAPSTREELLKAAAEAGIDGQFQFYGQVPDAAPALARMDVFGYLLNPQHFGATENALLEAMAAGLPVIALDQCVERGIIRNGETGLLVRSPEEYGNAVRYLREHPDKAAQLGAAARMDMKARYGIQANRRRFLAVCRRAMADEKQLHHFDKFFAGGPADWFLSAVGTDRACFEENRVRDSGRIFHEGTKGSPIHYHHYFPEDARLAAWAGQLT